VRFPVIVYPMTKQDELDAMPVVNATPTSQGGLLDSGLAGRIASPLHSAATMTGISGNTDSGGLRAYWDESARPLASLVFVAPMLAVYEIGVIVLGHDAIRNAADVWLRQFLDLLGFGQHFLLPLLTCGILLAWHHVSHRPWRLNGAVLYGMLFESLLFGFLLMILAGFQSQFYASQFAACSADNGGSVSLPTLLVGFLGAGIYEELLFRLMLLPAVMGLLRLTGFSPRVSLITAIVATSLIFAAAHYHWDFEFAGRHFTTAHGEEFQWYSFTFRSIAGVYFSLLFAFRGFGIAAGSHALYDIFTLLP